MEKTRVKKGEKYWRIWAMDNHFEIRDSIDDYGAPCDQMFEMGNYFATKAEAEAMVKKLRAVLKGANVLEMPSEEDIKKTKNKLFNNWYDGLHNCVVYEDEAYGFEKAIDWLKSKIVK